MTVVSQPSPLWNDLTERDWGWMCFSTGGHHVTKGQITIDYCCYLTPKNMNELNGFTTFVSKGINDFSQPILCEESTNY